VTSSTDTPIRSHDDLLAVFFEAASEKRAPRIGPEMEKHGVYAGSYAPLPYEGDKGVLRILQELARRYGWTPEGETAGGPIIALRRGDDSITLEPGGQLELSGAAVSTVHDVARELAQHMGELAPISRELGIVWLGLGFHPFARREDLSWVPKMRYGIMRDYLPTRGSLAHDMMLRTCTVQANYDFGSEEDAIRKMVVGLRLAPLTAALFANSPFVEGKRTGGLSYRARVWLDVDNDRSGLVPALWKPGARFVDYVEWALDVPMFMIKRDGKKYVNVGQTFRSFWKDGFEGLYPTQTDWQTHLNTLFPEVRLKRTVEVRGADAQGAAMAPALPALFAGIYYDAKALAEAEALTADFGHDEVQATRASVAELGLRSTFRGKPLRDLAEKVLTIASGGLARRAMKDAAGNDERVHLDPLVKLVERGMTPADVLVAGWDEKKDFRQQVLERATLAMP
jgi:glutamate--cysteine ligase